MTIIGETGGQARVMQTMTEVSCMRVRVIGDPRTRRKNAKSNDFLVL